MDLNGDGVITAEEFAEAQRRERQQQTKPGKGRAGGGGNIGGGGYDGGAARGYAIASPVMQVMQSVNRLQINEKVSVLEAGAALLGQEVEMPNTYHIIDPVSHRQLFTAEEQTDFFNRQMKQCCGDCAPWSIDINYTSPAAIQRVLHIDRPFSYTCLCCNRPTATVFDVASGARVGSITDPCTCFSTVFHVRDQAGKEIFTADGGCCQPGLWCPCPVGPCAQVDFDIKDQRSGQKVGHIRKQLPGVLSWLLAPDVDNYTVDFGKVRDPTHKALLMSLAIYMDFRYWNDSTRDNPDYGLPFLGVDREA